jgi:hypothetical protein
MEGRHPTHNDRDRPVPSWIQEWLGPPDSDGKVQWLTVPPKELEQLLVQLAKTTKDATTRETIIEIFPLASVNELQWKVIGEYPSPELQSKAGRLFLQNDEGRRVLINVALQSTFEKWTEALPFPLASILWRYHADAGANLKVDHLLYFFEALAQFATIVMLSALHSDRQLFKDKRSSWFRDDVQQSRRSQGLKQATFGYWVIIGNRLAKFTRDMLKTHKDRCLELYRTENADLIASLTSEDLYAILWRAKDHRNDWRGHCGMASEEEESRRLEILEWELANVEELLICHSSSPDGFIFHSRFEDSLLVTPRQSEYDGRVYDYEVDLLQGSRMIFRQIHVHSLDPMEKGKIYLLEPDVRRPLEIIPFFRIKPSPRMDEKACYFYNRVEKDGVRWISYHFADVVEKVERDEEVMQILAELEQT